MTEQTHPRKWWPKSLVDETMPEGRAAPSDWLEVHDGKLIFGRLQEDDGSFNYAGEEVAFGDTVEMEWLEHLGTFPVEFRSATDFFFTAAEAPKCYSECFVSGARENNADTLADLAGYIADSDGWYDLPVTIDVEFVRWGSQSFIVADSDNGPTVVPKEIVIEIDGPALDSEVLRQIPAVPRVQKCAEPLTFIYRNWRGEVSERRAIPEQIHFDSTQWHPEPQWLMRALDLEKGEMRDFAMRDMAPAYASVGKVEPAAAKRPPPPDPAAAGSVNEIVTRLYRRFKEWSKRGVGPDDVTWCEVKADIMEMILAEDAERERDALKAENERLRDALTKARRHVLSQNHAEGMFDGFGGRSPRPSDDDLAAVDAALHPTQGGA